MYIGVKVEFSNTLFFGDFKKIQKKYNNEHIYKILDFCYDGRVISTKIDGIVYAKHDCVRKGSGMSNFSALVPVKNTKDIKRILQIINVLGNDKLYREKVSTFLNKNSDSGLNKLDELSELKNVFMDINSLIPGFIKNALYYAPEIREI